MKRSKRGVALACVALVMMVVAGIWASQPRGAAPTTKVLSDTVVRPKAEMRTGETQPLPQVSASPASEGQIPMRAGGDDAGAGEDPTVVEGCGTVEGDALIVSLDADVDASEAAAHLRTLEGVEGVEAVSDGMLRVSLAGGTSLEDALIELDQSDGVVEAQPNFCYVAMDDVAVEGDDAIEVVDEAFDGAPDEGLTVVGETAGVTMAEESVEVIDDVVPGMVADGRDPIEVVGETTEPSMAVAEEPLVAQALAVSDTRVGEQWALTSIGAFDAWSLARCDNQVTIASLDLGCDVSHPDLAANIVAPYNAYAAVRGGNVSDLTPAAINPRHGTHVAGILGAVSNNALGVSGVSYNARVMPIQVVDALGNAYTDVLVRAYDYVLEHAADLNVRVINLSMGTKVDKVKDTALLRKIDEAYAAGIVTVSVAGNRNVAAGWNPPFTCYPGDYDKVVSVINLKRSGSGVVRADESNYNAPGERCKNIAAPGNGVLSCTPGSSYGTLSGTSMAAPHVSATLALMFRANPSLSVDEAVRRLYASATDVGTPGFDEETGCGEVSVSAAVRAAVDSYTSAVWQRVAGSDRYQTMAKIAQTGFASSSWAVLTCGENFPDALASASLAGARQCPILITGRSSLAPAARAELVRLGVDHVYVVGGSSSVSDAVLDEVRSVAGDVRRIAGGDRQATSLAVFREVAALGALGDAVVIATGSSFPDSLSCGPWSYAACAPILLTGADGRVGADALRELAGTAGIARAVIVGGTNSVSSSVETQLADICATERVSGADRYATSAEIANWSCAHGLGWGTPALATGENFPDALTGAACLGRMGSPIVLVHTAGDAGANLLTAHRSSYARGLVLGGTNSVPDELVRALDARS